MKHVIRDIEMLDPKLLMEARRQCSREIVTSFYVTNDEKFSKLN